MDEEMEDEEDDEPAVMLAQTENMSEVVDQCHEDYYCKLNQAYA